MKVLQKSPFYGSFVDVLLGNVPCFMVKDGNWLKIPYSYIVRHHQGFGACALFSRFDSTRLTTLE